MAGWMVGGKNNGLIGVLCNALGCAFIVCTLKTSTVASSQSLTAKCVFGSNACCKYFGIEGLDT